MELDIKLKELSLADLEELARDMRLGLEARARLENEARIGDEHQRRLEIVEVAKRYLPECLHERIAFHSYNQSRHYEPVLIIDGGDWRIAMRLYYSNGKWQLWSANAFETLLPQVADDDEKFFIWWRDTNDFYDNLVEAIGQAMVHPSLNDLELEAARRNAERYNLQKQPRELQYLPADMPDTNSTYVIAPLVQLIRDVALEVVREQTL